MTRITRHQANLNACTIGIALRPEPTPGTAATRDNRRGLRHGGLHHAFELLGDGICAFDSGADRELGGDGDLTLIGLRQQLDAVVMLDPGGRATFALSLRDVVSKKPRPTDSPVMPELERLRGTRVICAYSRQEPAAFCPRVDSTLVRVVLRSGGRTLRSADSRPIAQLITERNGP